MGSKAHGGQGNGPDTSPGACCRDWHRGGDGLPPHVLGEQLTFCTGYRRFSDGLAQGGVVEGEPKNSLDNASDARPVVAEGGLCGRHGRSAAVLGASREGGS